MAQGAKGIQTSCSTASIEREKSVMFLSQRSVTTFRKMKPWTSEHADQKFSELIRARDKVCVRCRWKPSSDCSHFFERDHSSTRYHVQNCDGVCRECHQFWHAHRADYKRFKIQQIGWKDFIALERLSALTMKRDEAIIKLMELLKQWT